MSNLDNFDPQYQSKEAGGFSPSHDKGSTPSSKRATRPADSQVLVPLTIKQIKSAHQDQDEVFRVEYTSIATVSFVGKVVSIDKKPLHAILVVTDGTESIEVKVWHNDDKASSYISSKLKELSKGEYVRIFGTIRMWEKKNSVVSYKFSIIEDHNEITRHFLDVIETYHFFTQGRLPSDMPEQEGVAQIKQNDNQNNGENEESDQTAEALGFIYDAITHLQQNNQGGQPIPVSIEDIVTALNKQLGESEVRSLVSELKRLGHAFDVGNDCVNVEPQT